VKKVVSLTLLTILSLDAESLVEVFENLEVDGYLRATYQAHDIKSDRVHEDDAIGGKLHLETGVFYGLSGGVSFYSSNALVNNENRGLVPLRGESHKSYSILGEAYLKTEFSETLLKVGRQEIETPFAQADDIGMVPNTFEAAMFESRLLKDTTLVLGQVQKMAGVDADSVDSFKRLNGSDNMQLLGLSYEGIPHVVLDAWYYNLKDAEVNKIAYVEASYEKEFKDITFGTALQYAKQGYSVGESANIYGVGVDATVKKFGLSVAAAYTEARDNAAFSGFGGGPFFSNSEYFILDNAGDDAKAIWFGAEYNAKSMGVEALTVALGEVTLENKRGEEASELDFTASYEINKNAEVHLIASKLKGTNVGEDDAKHLRVFANYNF